MMYVATRNVLTGYMSGVECVGDEIGAARAAAQARAETLLTGSVWLTTGHPDVRYSAVLEMFPACMVEGVQS